MKARLKVLPDTPRGGAWPPSARTVRCPVKSGNERDPRPLLRQGRYPALKAGFFSGTLRGLPAKAGGRCGRRQVRMPRIPRATRAQQWAGQWGSDPVRGRKSPKPAPSSDCGLQLARMTAESLVIGGHYSPGEYVPAPCTHRPSCHPSWPSARPGQNPGRAGGRRGGQSCHKVAVGEPAAGSPPQGPAGGPPNKKFLLFIHNDIPMRIYFEVKHRDAAGRCGVLKVRNREVETPFIFPVVNPNKMIITPKEMRKYYGVEAIITNAYILYRSKQLKHRILEDGLHKFLKFDGIIETDSGAYQMVHYKKELEVSNREIINFQIDIGADIINVLDIPTDVDADYEQAQKDLYITIERIKEGLDIIRLKDYNGGINGAIQGGIYKDLRKISAERVSKLDVDIFAIGTIVPYMINYNYKDLFHLVMEARIHLPLNKPVHLFGLGHPLIMPLAVSIGADIFDSASYALYAYDKRILTPFGTYRLDELREFLFETPKGSYRLSDIKSASNNEIIKLIAEHNLYTLLKEIKIIRDAIKNGYLWDIVLIKAHSHYTVYKATKFILENYYRWLKKLDPIRKNTGIKYYGDLLELRTDVRRALERLKERVDPRDVEAIYDYTYPFNSLRNVREI